MTHLINGFWCYSGGLRCFFGCFWWCRCFVLSLSLPDGAVQPPEQRSWWELNRVVTISHFLSSHIVSTAPGRKTCAQWGGGGVVFFVKVKKENILLISCNQVSCDYDDWDDGKQLVSKMISVVDFCDDHNHPDKRETGYSNILGWNDGEYLVISSLRWFGSLEQNFMANQNLTHGYPETKLSNHDFYKQVSRGKTI